MVYEFEFVTTGRYTLRLELPNDDAARAVIKEMNSGTYHHYLSGQPELADTEDSQCLGCTREDGQDVE